MSREMPTFEEAYRTHRGLVYRLCLKMVKDPVEAEDLTQEAFLQLWRKRHTFRGESAFGTWLHRLTINVVLMKLRKKKNAVSHPLSLDELNDNYEAEGHPAFQRAISAEDQELRSVSYREDLMRALEQLPPGYRTILILHDIEGMEHNEIADVLQTSLGTSKSQLHRARMALAEIVGAPPPQAEEPEPPSKDDLDSLFAGLEKYA